MKEFRKTKNGLFICEECSKLCKNKCGLSHHIYKNHYPEQYYNKWLKDKNDICKICGKETEFLNFINGYKNTCSQKCKSEIRKETCLKKYGVEYSWQSETLKEKSKQTKIKKYRDKNYCNVEKIKQTKKEKYGNENYRNEEKIKETCLEKYGVENPSQNEKIKEKKKQTCLKNYGVKAGFLDVKKSKMSKLKKYGDENFNNRKKSQQTCLSKYSVKNPSQNKKIFEKQQKAAYLLKQYKNTKLYYRASYEKDFLDKYLLLFPDIINAKAIKYIFKEKQHYYFPDFYIPFLNLIVEIKNSWLNEKDKEAIEAKKQGTIIKGFNYIKIVEKDYLDFNTFLS